MRNWSYMKFWFLIGFIFTMFITGCTGKEGSKGLITVSPASTVVTLDSSVPFSIAPAGTAVTWSVNEVAGKTVGTVDSNGLYKAPSDPSSSPERVVVKATVSSDSAATATVFLTTFNSNKRISTNYTEGAGRADTYSSGQRGIAVFKDENGIVNIYMVWADNSTGISQIWFSKSSDNGTTFSQPVGVAESVHGKQISPSIAVDNSGKAYVVWEDYRGVDADIFMSTYDGENFDPIPKKINTDIAGLLDYDATPSIAVSDSGDVCIVWEYRHPATNHYPDINFARSTDQGQTFLQAKVAVDGRRPSIAVDSAGIAYVVWEDLTKFQLQSPTHIMMRTVGTNNTLPGPPKQLDSVTEPKAQARFPSVSVTPDGKKVYVVWQRAVINSPGFENEAITSYDIDLAVIDVPNDSISQIASIPDSNNAGYFGGYAYPSIASDGNSVYIVWDDQRNGTKDIYFSRSPQSSITGDVATFTTNRIVNDELGTWHEKPSIAVSDGKAYVMWTDYRNTSLVTTVSPSDVFFARE